MPNYRIEALERLLVRTVYHVDATTGDEAEAMCKSREIAYQHHEIEEGDEEWVETVSIQGN